MQYNLPVNPYPQDQGIIDLIKAFFTPIWNGLSNINVPGFGFTFSEFLIALLTASLIGFILKTAFHYLGKNRSGRSSVKRSGSFKKGEELDD